MEKKHPYETVVILDPTLPADELEGQVNGIQDVITKTDGDIQNIDRWGRKRLAYEINKFNDGYYFVVYYNGLPQTILELDRVLKINDKVIRHMTIKNEEEKKNG